MKYVYQLPALKRSPLGPMLKCCSVNLYGLAIHILLPLFFLPSSIFEVVSFFLILPVLLSPLQLVIYSVWWCCLFRVFMLVFHADVYRVYCRIYYVVLNPSKSVELYIRLLTMMRNSGMCTFPISAFQKKNYQSSPTFCRLLVATILLFPAVFWRFCSRSTSIWKPCSSSMSILVASEG